MKDDTSAIQHAFQPVYDNHSRVLILGTMPSPKSRQAGFYYSHPQNRFWSVLAEVLGDSLPATIEEKRQFLHKHRIALWDVLHSCEIKGADDASIRKPVANDMNIVLKNAQIMAVFTTGKKAAELYGRLCLNETNHMPATCLPSTSPANRRFSHAGLVEAYGAILEFLQNNGTQGD